MHKRSVIAYVSLEVSIQENHREQVPKNRQVTFTSDYSLKPEKDTDLEFFGTTS